MQLAQLFCAFGGRQSKVHDSATVENNALQDSESGKGSSTSGEVHRQTVASVSYCEYKIQDPLFFALRNSLGCCVPLDLHMAVLDSNLHLAKVTIQRFVRSSNHRELINKIDTQGETALTLAIKCQQQDIIELIINANGIDVNLSNTSHMMTPIQYASYLGLTSIAKKLLERRDILFDATSSDGKSKTALMLACFRKHNAIVRALIDAGADLDKRDEVGWDALFYAVLGGSAEIVEILLDEGVNRYSIDRNQCTILDLAEQMGFTAIVSLLKEHKVRLAPPGLNKIL